MPARSIAVQHVGVAELGAERQPEEVEVADGTVCVDGELRHAVLAHERLEVRPHRVGALGQRVVALVEHLVEDLDALVRCAHLVGVRVHQDPADVDVVPGLDDRVDLAADVLDRLGHEGQQLLRAGRTRWRPRGRMAAAEAACRVGEVSPPEDTRSAAIAAPAVSRGWRPVLVAWPQPPRPRGGGPRRLGAVRRSSGRSWSGAARLVFPQAPCAMTVAIPPTSSGRRPTLLGGVRRSGLSRRPLNAVGGAPVDRGPAVPRGVVPRDRLRRGTSSRRTLHAGGAWNGTRGRLATLDRWRGRLAMPQSRARRPAWSWPATTARAALLGLADEGLPAIVEGCHPRDATMPTSRRSASRGSCAGRGRLGHRWRPASAPPPASTALQPGASAFVARNCVAGSPASRGSRSDAPCRHWEVRSHPGACATCPAWRPHRASAVRCTPRRPSVSARRPRRLARYHLPSSAPTRRGGATRLERSPPPAAVRRTSASQNVLPSAGRKTSSPWPVLHLDGTDRRHIPAPRRPILTDDPRPGGAAP